MAKKKGAVPDPEVERDAPDNCLDTEPAEIIEVPPVKKEESIDQSEQQQSSLGDIHATSDVPDVVFRKRRPKSAKMK